MREGNAKIADDPNQSLINEGLLGALDAAGMAVCIAVLGPEHVSFTNQRFQGFFSLSDADLSHDHNLWLERLNAEDGKRLRAAYEACRDGKGSAIDCEVSTNIGGRSARLHIRGSGFHFDGVGVSPDIFLWMVDEISSQPITPPHELEEMQKMEILAQLAGGVFHHFNNMLMSIIGFSGLALARVDSEQNKKLHGYLSEIYQAGHRAKSLIAKVLDCRLEASGELKRLELAQLIKESEELLRAMLPSAVDVRLVTQDDVPDIFGDAAQLLQALLSMALSAKEALGGAGGLEVRAGRFQGNGLCTSCQMPLQQSIWVELVVCGAGPSLPEGLSSAAFEQRHISRLNWLQHIAHEHKGHVQIEAGPGARWLGRVLFPVAVQN